ncbi:MAG: Fe-S protein assembly co-chaperone HscB [Gammaproteobacteria bacterium]|jgi:molecular chaperone HscB
MDFNFAQSYFELFGLPVGFDVDSDQLKTRYQKLQSELHPDRFAGADAQAKRLSVQATSLVNEAYGTLRDPRLRARYLLHLKGVEFDDERETSSDPEFLMQQMELRERLDESAEAEDALNRLDTFIAEVRTQARSLDEAFAAQYAAEDIAAAKDSVLKMRFHARLIEEAQARQARLEDELL